MSGAALPDSVAALGGRVAFEGGSFVARCNCRRVERFMLLSAATTWLEACARHERPHAPAPTSIPAEPVKQRE